MTISVRSNIKECVHFYRMEAGLVTPEPKAPEDASKKVKVSEEVEEKPKDDKKEKALKKKEKVKFCNGILIQPIDNNNLCYRIDNEEK